MTSSLNKSVFSPKQERSANTQAAILGAAREMITEGGIKSLTVSAVAARVGLTTGAFYARFRSKDALLEMLFDEILENNRQSVNGFIEEMDKSNLNLTEFITRFIPPAVTLVKDNSALFRLFGSNHSGPISETDRTILLLEDVIKPLQKHLKKHADAIPGRDPDLCASMLVVMIQGMADFAIILRHSKKPLVPMDDKTLSTEITRAVLGYLDL